MQAASLQRRADEEEDKQYSARDLQSAPQKLRVSVRRCAHAARLEPGLE
jgi:hypothetical protein